MAIFVVIPVALVRHGGLAVSEHWKVYLPVVLGSFVLMMPPLLQAERRGRMRFLFLAAIVLLLAARSAWRCATRISRWRSRCCSPSSSPSTYWRRVCLRWYPGWRAGSRGTALGVYNTTRRWGCSSAGPPGAGCRTFGEASVFVFGIAIVALWLGTAWRMRIPGESAERIFPLRAGRSGRVARELVRLRGVREAVVVPKKALPD